MASPWASPGIYGSKDLLRYADTALYRAKAKGRARYDLFDLQTGANAVDQFYLGTDLWKAIEKEQLKLYYQPEFSVASGQLVGFEALLRWNHPTRGLLAPSFFVSLAEESGSLVSIGLWVIEEACCQLQRWRDLYPNQGKLEMSLNLSVRQLQDKDFVRKVAEILAATGTQPESLRLEITESMVVEDSGEARAILVELKGLGLRLAIDDFGTGYSSLSYLSSLPVDTVKIDQSFIAGIEGDDANLLIVQGIITIAHDLGLTVTAEGIETAAQLAALRRVHCDRGQGFLLAEPLPSEVVRALIESHGGIGLVEAA